MGPPTLVSEVRWGPLCSSHGPLRPIPSLLPVIHHPSSVSHPSPLPPRTPRVCGSLPLGNASGQPSMRRPELGPSGWWLQNTGLPCPAHSEPTPAGCGAGEWKQRKQAQPLAQGLTSIQEGAPGVDVHPGRGPVVAGLSREAASGGGGSMASSSPSRAAAGSVPLGGRLVCTG